MATVGWRYLFLVLVTFLAAGPGRSQVAGDAISVQPLRNVAEVRGLTYKEAKSGPPVVLRVVVNAHLFTGFDGQDDTGGVFFESEEVPPLGETVEIIGNVTGGRYSPYVVVDEIRKLGKTGHPSPWLLTPDFLQTGVGDNRWLEASLFDPAEFDQETISFGEGL